MSVEIKIVWFNKHYSSQAERELADLLSDRWEIIATGGGQEDVTGDDWRVPGGIQPAGFVILQRTVAT